MMMMMMMMQMWMQGSGNDVDGELVDVNESFMVVLVGLCT